MTTDNFINQLFSQLNDAALPGAEALSKELQQKLRTAAQSAFDRLDIVTRDEFDAQKAVLLRTREKLEALEVQLESLQNQQQKK